MSPSGWQSTWQSAPCKGRGYPLLTRGRCRSVPPCAPPPVASVAGHRGRRPHHWRLVARLASTPLATDRASRVIFSGRGWAGWGRSAVVPRTRDEARGRRLARFPDTQLPPAKPRAGGRRWLPDIQSPTPDAPPGVGGHTRADLVDHQPRPQGHHPGIDRDGLPGAGPARGRNPLARMAAHLEDAKLGPTGARRTRRRGRGGRPGCPRRRGRGRVRGSAGRQEDSTRDRSEQRNRWRPQAGSVSSADRHVLVLLQRVTAPTDLRAKTKCKPWPNLTAGVGMSRGRSGGHSRELRPSRRPRTWLGPTWVILAAGEQVARIHQEPGLPWLERQAEVAEDLVAERQAAAKRCEPPADL
jgi:hypothetical protein